jgi:hypothetical protein
MPAGKDMRVLLSILNPCSLLGFIGGQTSLSGRFLLIWLPVYDTWVELTKGESLKAPNGLGTAPQLSIGG